MDEQKFRVLIVDDDSTIRSLLAEALTEEGFESATAANGLEAMANVEAAQPNLVLLDIQMPKMDGRAFLRALAEKQIRIPVILMSAAVSPRSFTGELNADGYLAKPFDLDHVVDQVERIFAQWSDTKQSVLSNGLNENKGEGALTPNPPA